MDPRSRRLIVSLALAAMILLVVVGALLQNA